MGEDAKREMAVCCESSVSSKNVSNRQLAIGHLSWPWIPLWVTFVLYGCGPSRDEGESLARKSDATISGMVILDNTRLWVGGVLNNGHQAMADTSPIYPVLVESLAEEQRLD